MGEDGSALKILRSTAIEKKFLRRPRYRREETIRFDLKKIVINKTNWIDTA